jgi:hypothetical protein
LERGRGNEIERGGSREGGREYVRDRGDGGRERGGGERERVGRGGREREG